jgi:hypothetical protein
VGQLGQVVIRCISPLGRTLGHMRLTRNPWYWAASALLLTAAVLSLASVRPASTFACIAALFLILVGWRSAS